MSANPIDLVRLRKCRVLIADGIIAVDGTRRRRHSADSARRTWYARHRAERFARR